jgi:hypothetical protein
LSILKHSLGSADLFLNLHKKQMCKNTFTPASGG